MANNSRVGVNVGGLRPRRNVFDLSYRTNFTCDIGQLIPVFCEEVVPGDYFKIGAEMVIRFQPLAAPIMHELRGHIHYFFVPKRLEYGTTNEEKNLWEEFISQGDLTSEDLPIQLPVFDRAISEPAVRDLGTLWDYFGFPVTREAIHDPNNVMVPLDTPWRVYNKVYNEYYRDQDLQSEVGDGIVRYPDGHPNAGERIPINPYVLNRNWAKDYFTAARPWRYKGDLPALPVDMSFSWDNLTSNISARVGLRNNPADGFEALAYNVLSTSNIQPDASTSQPIGTRFERASDSLPANTIAQGSNFAVSYNDIGNNLIRGLNAQSTTFDVSDLRLAFQTQKWLERNARGGTRYTEFLRSHFGVSPSDARLDRPEYIGGVKVPIMINEVLQTSQTVSEQSMLGQMGGHGLAADGQYVGEYNVQEYGTIIGIMSVLPKPQYQQGINRQWLRRLPTDFYFPEFARLSEQAIYVGEIYSDWGRSDPWREFGFTGQYDEMRVKYDKVCGEMRIINDPNMLNQRNPLLSYWNMARWFNSKPLLNSTFITCDPNERKDVFHVRNKPGLIVNVQNNVRATRPLPAIADPGLIDHY